jgi:hypothetical protein
MKRLALLGLVVVLGCDGGSPAGVDGGSDASADAPVATDGAADTGTPPADGGGDGGPSTWCATNHPSATLCDDFDLGPTLNPAWSAAGTGLMVVTMPYKTAPRALQMTVPPATASTVSLTSATAPQTSTRVELDLQITQDGTMAMGGSPGVLSILGANNPQSRVVLAIVPGTQTARCAVAGLQTANPSFYDVAFARNAWHTVALELVGSGTGPFTAHCVVDGQNHDAGWTNLTTAAAVGKTTVTVGIGSTATATMQAFYDDVVIDMK